tara:strand:+ start:1959 stop:2570 length:612 start_codon:yes stop_codon:yes gene_type:complete
MSESKPNIQPNPSTVYEKPVARMFDFYLTGDIKEAREYQDWNQILRTASETDAVVIHINSPGGDIFTIIQMMRSMAESPATVVASVEGMCMSAATLLFLSADVCEISEHSHFMFHTYSSGNWGKGSEQLANVQADDKWARHLFNTVYKDFLSVKEIKEIVDGKDLWMNPAEVKKRLEARNKAHEKGKGPKRTKKALLRGKKSA